MIKIMNDKTCGMYKTQDLHGKSIASVVWIHLPKERSSGGLEDTVINCVIENTVLILQNFLTITFSRTLFHGFIK